VSRTDDDEIDAFSISTFCRRHGISVPFFNRRRDEMPQVIKIGVRSLITREAAERWRKDREKAAKAPPKTASSQSATT